ncbi:glycosyltransferase [Cobetia sp. UIB-001]|uniref:glycosyltransferase n=1 Tax=Cobetia sp. UIB-001 TaxID=2717697 RepID=UPI00384BAA90
MDEEKGITVLHVIAHIEKGGAERQLSLLARDSRYQHIIAVLAGNESESTALVELLPSLSPFSIYKKVRWLVKKYQVDIVQLWLPDRLTIPAMFAAKKENCKIVSSDRRKVRNYGKGAVRDRLPYINHLGSDIVIPNYPHFLPCLSLRRMLGINNYTHTILNGMELIERKRDIDSIPHRLLFVGRLVEQKRVKMLVKAMPQLMSETGITGLDIVGEGPEGSSISKLINELNLKKEVILHGRLKDWGVRFEPSTHILVLPSASEGMSNTLFESIAWGFYPIVSKSKELIKILESWSQLPGMINHRDASTLILEVNKIRSQKGAVIQEKVRVMQSELRNFSVERMTKQYDSVYEDLISDHDIISTLKESS